MTVTDDVSSPVHVEKPTEEVAASSKVSEKEQVTDAAAENVKAADSKDGTAAADTKKEEKAEAGEEKMEDANETPDDVDMEDAKSEKDEDFEAEAETLPVNAFKLNRKGVLKSIRFHFYLLELACS